MKWLVIQSDGVHKGQNGFTRNDYLREYHAIRHALEKLGHTVDVWGKRHDHFLTHPDFASYDAFFSLEQYEMEWLPDLRPFKEALKIQWIVDLHCHSAGYEKTSESHDVILHSTQCLMPEYARKFPTKKHLWFPNAVDDRYFDRCLYHVAKTRDLVFIGSDNPERTRFIESVKERCGLVSYFATGETMIQGILEAKIHFNKNIGCDLNYRHFETIGLGTCLLTEYQPDLEELGFVDNYNCLMYSSAEECIRKARAAIHDRTWENIGNNGYLLSKSHTYTKRLEGILLQLGVAASAGSGPRVLATESGGKEFNLYELTNIDLAYIRAGMEPLVIQLLPDGTVRSLFDCPERFWMSDGERLRFFDRQGQVIGEFCRVGARFVGRLSNGVDASVGPDSGL